MQQTVQIVITAGGTSEPIDGVRKITNTSTGRLGWECLLATIDSFNQQQKAFKIHYIHTQTAFLGEINDDITQQVTFIEADTTQEVYHAVDTLTRKQQIDYFVHAMAISDFSYHFSIPIQHLALEIANTLKANPNIGAEEIRKILSNPTQHIPQNRKITSKDALYIALQPTPKVIALIKQNNPKTVLIGFKLLRNVEKKELLQAAKRLTDKNGCDMVFANLLSQTGASNHTGMLIANNRIIATPLGKENIAKTIVEQMQKATYSSQKTDKI